MEHQPGVEIGTVVGNTSPNEFQFILRNFWARTGDIVSVRMKVPSQDGDGTRTVLAWGRIVELGRFNPFLPAESGQELAAEGIQMLDTVLSLSRDQVQGTVLVLGCTSESKLTSMSPLSYPVKPGSQVIRPHALTVKRVLTGGEEHHRIHLGTLIGRRDVNVDILTNAVVARHMAILAMTGGGKTVAARRVITGCVQALLQYRSARLTSARRADGNW